MKQLAAVLATLAALWSTFAAGQAPPIVPALPDSSRLTQYSISGTNCACSVNFAIYGDGTDVDEWIQVFIGSTAYLSTDPTFGWSLSSATGSLGSIPRPITNAVLTFNNVQTGTVTILGARRPRRLSQFTEGRGVAARDLNQAITDEIAMLREGWDLGKRSIVGQPGETLQLLPPAATRQGKFLGFDSSGQPIATPSAFSSAALDATFGSTRGSILERGAAGWVINTPGTSGLSWVSNGPGADPAYQVLPSTGISNVVSSKTTNYTIATSDCGSTIQAGTGSTGLFTVTLPSASGFSAGCWVAVKNGDTVRGKKLSGFPADLQSAILYPLQTVILQVQNGAWATLHNPGRWRIPGNVSIFVDATNGNDTNDCLAVTTGACATYLQALINAVDYLDFGFNTVTLQMANATYTAGWLTIGEFLGPGQLVIDGGGGTLTGGMSLFMSKCTSLQSVVIQNVTISNTAGDAMHVSAGCITIGSGVTFAATTGGNHMIADGPTARIKISNNYSISGGAQAHFAAVAGGAIDNAVGSYTITLTGTPAFSTAFAADSAQSIMYLWNLTFSGSATGPRYSASGNSTIVTGTSTSTAAGACSIASAAGSGTTTYFPGNSAGSIINGGCYF